MFTDKLMYIVYSNTRDFLDKLQNNVVDCFSEKLNENEIEEDINNVNDRRGCSNETSRTINRIKERNPKNETSKFRRVDTTREIPDIFNSRLFTRDRIKQATLRSIQSNDKG